MDFSTLIQKLKQNQLNANSTRPVSANYDVTTGATTPDWTSTPSYNKQPITPIKYTQSPIVPLNPNIRQTTTPISIPQSLNLPGLTRPPVVTPAAGSSQNVNNYNAADAINHALGFSSNYSNPVLNQTQGQPQINTPQITTPTQDSQDLYYEMLNNRALNKGRYEIDPSKQFSPDQINMMRNATDNTYQAAIADKRRIEDAANQTNTSLDALVAGDQTANALRSMNFGSAANKRDILQAYAATPVEQRPAFVEQQVLKTFTTKQREAYDSNNINSNKYLSAVNYYSKPENKVTQNYYNTKYNDLKKYAVVSKDPEFIRFNSLMGEMTASKISELYGAVLAVNEEQRANLFLPNSSDTFGDVLNKAQNLALAAKYDNLYKINQALGVQTPDFMTYLTGTQSYTGGTTNGYKTSSTGGIDLTDF